MKFKIGDKVKIIRMRNPNLERTLEGLIGTIREVRDFNGENVYEVVAENFGRKMMTGRGSEKNVYAWIPGNHTARFSDELSIEV